MSIKLHHGGNGAYKTSGCIQDDVIPELKKGRVIVTNIRGLTLEAVYKVFPELPDTAEVINIDSDTSEGMERVRTWFRWVPKGALIVFDETQNIFPKSWREKELSRFTFQGTREEAAELNQPYDWLDAWTRHRHFGWDIVLTTPDIKYVRDDIRNTSEAAYYHANLALVGIKGRYRETAHNPSENKPGPKAPSFTKKIKKETFACYESTATGAVRDTRAGFNAFASGRLFFAVAMLIGGLALALYNSGSVATGNGSTQTVSSSDLAKNQTTPSVSEQVSTKNNNTAGVVSNNQQATISRGPSAVRGGLLKGFEIFIDLSVIANQRHEYYFSIHKDGETGFKLSHREIELAGYEVLPKTDCLVILVASDGMSPVTCSRGREKQDSEKGKAESGV